MVATGPIAGNADPAADPTIAPWPSGSGGSARSWWLFRLLKLLILLGNDARPFDSACPRRRVALPSGLVTSWKEDPWPNIAIGRLHWLSVPVRV